MNRDGLKLLADIYDFSQLSAAGQLFETETLFVLTNLSVPSAGCKI